METLNDKLSHIQTHMKAPKGQFNSFGKYSYRSLEDITEAIKPFLTETKTTLRMQDHVVCMGDRFYVVATVTLSDGKESISSTGYAREPENKKGMDESQITGTSSSYARKYACNGLFALDDTKDADSDEYQKKQEPVNPTKKADNKHIGVDFSALKNRLLKCKTMDDLITYTETPDFISWQKRQADVDKKVIAQLVSDQANILTK